MILVHCPIECWGEPWRDIFEGHHHVFTLEAAENCAWTNAISIIHTTKVTSTEQKKQNTNESKECRRRNPTPPQKKCQTTNRYKPEKQNVTTKVYIMYICRPSAANKSIRSAWLAPPWHPHLLRCPCLSVEYFHVFSKAAGKTYPGFIWRIVYNVAVCLWLWYLYIYIKIDWLNRTRCTENEGSIVKYDYYIKHDFMIYAHLILWRVYSLRLSGSPASSGLSSRKLRNGSSLVNDSPSLRSPAALDIQGFIQAESQWFVGVHVGKLRKWRLIPSASKSWRTSVTSSAKLTAWKSMRTNAAELLASRRNGITSGLFESSLAKNSKRFALQSFAVWVYLVYLPNYCSQSIGKSM